MIQEILFFIREEPYGSFSNFERTGFEAESWGKKYWYPTNEHYYQSQKANNQRDHDDIVGLSRATQAMELGRAYDHGKYLSKYCKKNWREVHADKVMLRGTRLKYKDPALRKLLLETGDAVLHENDPNNFYWGIADGTGKSMLGKILMQVREELRAYGTPVRFVLKRHMKGFEEYGDLYEAIKSGRKTVEYRNATDYWKTRLLSSKAVELLESDHRGINLVFREDLLKHSKAVFVVGYTKYPKLEADITKITYNRKTEKLEIHLSKDPKVNEYLKEEQD